MIEGLLLYYLYYPTAFLLGALHSFEPAHGKAVLVAYLVGNRRSFSDAVVMGVVITLAHTFSLIVLGVGAWLVAAHYRVATTGPAMSLAGGLVVLAVGFWMLLRWRAGACVHPGHGRHALPHTDAQARRNGNTGRGDSLGQLVMVGIGGGLVPCPAGVAMLMTAVAAGRFAQGIGLATAFSLGAGVIVVVLSVILYRASSLTARWFDDTSPFVRHTPMISSLLIIGIGLWLSAGAFIELMGKGY